MASPPARGRPERIALIHAVYAAAWAGLALLAGAPPGVAVALLAASLIAAALAVPAMRRGGGPHDPATGRAIARINIATALVVVVAFVGAHVARADRWVVPLVLAVMGLHFLPLWRLLHRGSLLAMGGALLAAAATVTRVHLPATAADGARAPSREGGAEAMSGLEPVEGSRPEAQPRPAQGSS